MVGGPAHGTVADVPVGPDGWPLTPLRWVVDDGDAARQFRSPEMGSGRRVVTYDAVQRVDPTHAIARDRRDPPWWWVYVPSPLAATPHRIEHLIDDRPIVDGPRPGIPHWPEAFARYIADPSRDVVPGR